MAKGDYNRLTQESFLAKALAVHGSKYEYSQAAYKGYAVKVRIICPEHGIFEQVAYAHLAGMGCKKCANKNAGQYHALSTESFIIKSQLIHGADYLNYSQAIYERQGIKVKIICPLHGLFEQEPSSHLAGSGCPGCADQCRAATNRARGRAAFIDRANDVHINKYDYSKAVYIDAHAKVKIGCPVHGLFEQVAIKHTSGHGCRRCADAGRKEKNRGSGWAERESSKPATLYFIKLFDVRESFYKIGVTRGPVKSRYYSANLSGYQYEILAQHTSTNASAVYDWEQSIIETFTHLRYKPSRPFLGATECFSEADPILAIFPL